MTIEFLLQLASRLDPRLESHLRNEWVEIAGSEVASCDHVEKLLSCYSSMTSHPCVEEIVGHVVRLQESLCRVDYLDIRTCGEIPTSVMHAAVCKMVLF